VYNFTGFSTCPLEMQSFILKRYPSFKMGYKIDFRQHIADNWPSTISANRAERHWGMKIDYGFEKSMEVMLEDVKQMYQRSG